MSQLKGLLKLPGDRSKVAILFVMVIILFAAMVAYLPPAVDWQKAYRPAAMSLHAGRSPYEISGYFNPPWTILPLLPIAILPQPVARTAAVLFALAAYAFGA